MKKNQHQPRLPTQETRRASHGRLRCFGAPGRFATPTPLSLPRTAAYARRHQDLEELVLPAGAIDVARSLPATDLNLLALMTTTKLWLLYRKWTWSTNDTSKRWRFWDRFWRSSTYLSSRLAHREALGESSVDADNIAISYSLGKMYDETCTPAEAKRSEVAGRQGVPSG